MNDTMVTLVGNAATAVEHRQTTAGVTVARFRLAATSRRWDKSLERWADGETSFYTVRSWRALADNVAASVAVGEPLVVQGRLRLREGEQPAERGGQRWFSAEVDAVAIGHDLSRGTAAFRRVLRAARTGGDLAPRGTPSPQPDEHARPQQQLDERKRTPAQSATQEQPHPQPARQQSSPRSESHEQPRPKPKPRPPASRQRHPQEPPLAVGAASAPLDTGNSPQTASVP
ncbi:single-stranded DNA-binding protein [Streptomyces sp. NPDC050355]|uniref:single-stranded DNA-binding protein n=1 Tax=Streptomyces sp. NPDC050355 TaxID=3365609 RepID=UPI0037878BF3